MVTPLIRSAFLAAAILLTPNAQVQAKVTPTIEDYGKLPAFEEAAMSPSGNRVALISTIKDLRTLMIFDGDTIIKRLDLGDVKVRDIEWATDDQLMLDFSQTEKLYGFTADQAEFYRTLFISMSSETPTLLFAKQRDLAKATFGWYGIRDIGGKTYGFFGGVPLKEYSTGRYGFEGGPPALYKVDLSDMKASQVAGRANETEWRTWRVDAAGNVAAKLIRKDADGSWRILNVDDKEIASGKNPMGGIRLLAFGQSGNTIIYRQEDESSGESRHFEVPLGGGPPTEVLADIDIDGYYTDPRSGNLLGYVISGAPPTRQAVIN